MPAKKVVAKSSQKSAKPVVKGAFGKPIGVVMHFYGGIGVAIVKFSKPVTAGTTVTFRGATTDFTQNITSLQYDHKEIKSAPKGKEVGVKVKDKVRDGDEVFLVA
jgi:putative protease